LEVHAIDALLRPAKNQPTQGRVRIYTRQALQVSAIRGDQLLTYRDESRIIPEGRTWQINLDPESATQKPAGSGGVNLLGSLSSWIPQAARPPASPAATKIAILLRDMDVARPSREE